MLNKKELLASERKKARPHIEKVLWECPYCFERGKRSGEECGKKHFIYWDTKFDSPCDGESLYCPRHTILIDKEEGVTYERTR